MLRLNHSQLLKKNRLLLFFLPVVLIYSSILPLYAILSFFLCWLMTKTLTRKQIIFRLTYVITIIINIYAYQNIFAAEFWIILLLLLVPLAIRYDKEKYHSLSLSIVSFITASIFIFKPSFFTTIFIFIWINFFLAIYINYKFNYQLNMNAVNWSRLIKFLTSTIFIVTIIFLIIPRFQVTLISNKNQKNDIGLEDTLNLQNDSFISTEKNEIYKIQIEGKLKKIPYWKVYVLTDYDNFKWQKGDQLTKHYPRSENLEENYSYKIIKNKYISQKNLPVLGNNPIKSGVQKNKITADGELILDKKLTNQYTEIEIHSSERTEVERTINYSHEIKSKLTQWAKDEYQKINDERDFVDFINNYFKNNFKYKINDLGLDKNNPIDSFFFDNRNGSCTHFASTMAHILRANEIPANVVIGYVGGEWNNFGKFITISSDNAHSWVEAKINNQWIYIDPTTFVDSPDLDRIDFNRGVFNFFDQDLNKSFLENISDYMSFLDITISKKIMNYGYSKKNSSIFLDYIEILLLISIPGFFILLIIYIFRSVKKFEFHPLNRLEKNYRQLLIKQGHKINPQNSLHVIEFSEKSSPETKQKIRLINRKILELKYGLNKNYSEIKAVSSLIKSELQDK